MDGGQPYQVSGHCRAATASAVVGQQVIEGQWLPSSCISTGFTELQNGVLKLTLSPEHSELVSANPFSTTALLMVELVGTDKRRLGVAPVDAYR
jgi:hypothetical protein